MTPMERLAYILSALAFVVAAVLMWLTYEQTRANREATNDVLLHIECIKVLGTWDYEGRRCTNSERRVRINPPLN